MFGQSWLRRPHRLSEAEARHYRLAQRATAPIHGRSCLIAPEGSTASNPPGITKSCTNILHTTYLRLHSYATQLALPRVLRSNAAQLALVFHFLGPLLWSLMPWRREQWIFAFWVRTVRALLGIKTQRTLLVRRAMLLLLVPYHRREAAYLSFEGCISKIA